MDLISLLMASGLFIGAQSNCVHTNIAHCKPGQQACGGSPDNIKCTDCYDPYYSAGYARGCAACPSITNCQSRHCTNPGNTICLRCYEDKAFFLGTHSDTKCERMCAWNNHYCWPGECSDKLTTSCRCASGFRAVKTSSETSCQLDETNTPTIAKCDTIAVSRNGEMKRASGSSSSTACSDMVDFYGNFQPRRLIYDLFTEFTVNVSTYTKPDFIHESNFGVTDVGLRVEVQSLTGNNTYLMSHNIFTTNVDSSDVVRVKEANSNISFATTFPGLSDGQWMCVIYQVNGGGFLRSTDLTQLHHVPSAPVSYRKTKATRRLCYRYDKSPPEHCNLNSCSYEPLHVSEIIMSTQLLTIRFPGWTDPVPSNGNSAHASGIESYELTVHEVASSSYVLKVDTEVMYCKKLESSVTSLTVNLTSDWPRLYAIYLEVKDVADNVAQARRFVLFDDSSQIEARSDKAFFVESASSRSKYTWQTNHNHICLNWTDHFYNKYYLENPVLNPVEPDPSGLISGVYEQITGQLPVSGTPNVYGIVEFKISWSLNDGTSSSEANVQNFLQQYYCYNFKVADGETYTITVRAIDIVSNSFAENRTVHIDRSVPSINNIWLVKDGIRRLFVHDRTDLSTMQLYFEALDPHSGIREVEWALGTSDSGSELVTGHIAINYTGKGCPSDISDDHKCYCPDVGKCEFYQYTVKMNRLVAADKYIGENNRTYFFTIKATNHAMLSNVEHLDILVVDSSLENGKANEVCQDIDHCKSQQCTNHGVMKCLRCLHDNVFFLRAHADTKCESMCAWNNHYCWPGQCSDKLTSSCRCVGGFHEVKSSDETSCQLLPTNAPTILTCDTQVMGSDGELKRSSSTSSSTACSDMTDFYGNFQPRRLIYDLLTDFTVDLYSHTRPAYIYDSNFGVTDVCLRVDIQSLTGSRLYSMNNTTYAGQADSSDVRRTRSDRLNMSLGTSLPKLSDGQMLCFTYEAYGGGFLRSINLTQVHQSPSSPVPYKKTKVSRRLCYRYDNMPPEHCKLDNSCTLEPLQVSEVIARNRSLTVSFSGWTDPIPVGGNITHASGIESYQLIVHEVAASKDNLIVGTLEIFSETIKSSLTSLTVNLTSDKPKLYAIYLEVKDVADNVKVTRRFVLFDDSSYIAVRPDKSFFVESASPKSNYSWQTHHSGICLNWTDHFYNIFYFENPLLNPIEPDPYGLINGVYEQQTGPLPVSGTPNVNGIVEFRTSWSLNGGTFSSESKVQNYQRQFYCNNFNVADGQTYTINIRAVDIANNSYAENRTVHIDRSAPHIRNIWLVKDGVHRSFVQTRTDLSQMELHFEAADQHSGIIEVEWTFGTSYSGPKLLTGHMLTNKTNMGCPNESSGDHKCYCPDVGECEFYQYTLQMNKLIAYIGDNNKTYFITIKSTNHAMLTDIHVEQLHILVVDSYVENHKDSRTKDSPVSILMIAGTAVGGILGLAIVILLTLLVVILHKRRLARTKGKPNGTDLTYATPSNIYEDLKMTDLSGANEDYDVILRSTSDETITDTTAGHEYVNTCHN